LPVDPALIARTYPGGRAQYLARFDARVDALVRQRWLLAPDAAAQKQAARRYADQAFPKPTHAGPSSGTLAGGARWVADMPAHWNGTLLLWSRGYSPKLGTPETAPANVRDLLLDKGYALLASDYGAAGWSLAQAVPAQRAALAAFARAYGPPRKTIAWGASMGGLVTTALAETPRSGINGGLALCPSIGGAVGMMNMALDGAYAFRTLVAPDAGVQLVGIKDDMANGRLVSALVADAARTPQGRARIALAGVLGGIPGWTTRGAAEPTDAEAQAGDGQRVERRHLPAPRGSGGASGRRVFMEHGRGLCRATGAFGPPRLCREMYRKAGLDLSADLARLNGGTRVAAKPSAVTYMMAHYTPNARPLVPLLSVQAVGDGATSPSLQRAYVEVAKGRDVDALWLNQAGHCGFAPEQLVSAIRHLEKRQGRATGPARPPASSCITRRPCCVPARAAGLVARVQSICCAQCSTPGRRTGGRPGP
jgi:hypothetical protein